MKVLNLLRNKITRICCAENDDKLAEWEKGLKFLQKNIEYKFKNDNLLKSALMHLSYVRKNGSNNEIDPVFERMEFLGDSVLGLVTAEFLFLEYPDKTEGALSKLKSKIVSEPYLALKAKDIKLGNHILMSDEELKSGGREKKSILSNTVESLICAIFLDSDLNSVKKFIHNIILENYEKEVKNDDFVNYKSRLQEYCQSIYHEPPVYVLTGEKGPDHQKTFYMDVYINEEKVGKGEGFNKKEAQKDAAKNACVNMKI